MRARLRGHRARVARREVPSSLAGASPRSERSAQTTLDLARRLHRRADLRWWLRTHGRRGACDISGRCSAGGRVKRSVLDSLKTKGSVERVSWGATSGEPLASLGSIIGGTRASWLSGATFPSDRERSPGLTPVEAPEWEARVPSARGAHRAALSTVISRTCTGSLLDSGPTAAAPLNAELGFGPLDDDPSPRPSWRRLATPSGRRPGSRPESRPEGAPPVGTAAPALAQLEAIPSSQVHVVMGLGDAGGGTRTPTPCGTGT